jgi:hypothetical protein
MKKEMLGFLSSAQPTSWQRWVINYNNANQSSFMLSFGIKDMKTMVYWMMVFVGIITAILSLFLLYQKPKQTDPVLKAYNRFLKKLAKAGFTKDTGEGPRDFAERIKPNLPNQAEQIETITTIFIGQQYGKKPTVENFKQLYRLVSLLKV